MAQAVQIDSIIKCKVVTVIDKDNKQLAPCTVKRAAKLVARKCAKWDGFNKIKLLVNNEDRRQLRKEVIEEADRTCYICQDKIPHDEHPTLDHVKPKVGRGEDKKENLRCCCKRCNDDKSDMTLKQYIKHIELNRISYVWIKDKCLTDLKKMVIEYS